jgi:hypothetical protein
VLCFVLAVGCEVLSILRRLIRYEILKRGGLKEERVILLEAWREMESNALQDELEGSSRDKLSEVDGKFPKKIMRRRRLDNGAEEEYFDYVFADDEKELGKSTTRFLLNTSFDLSLTLSLSHPCRSNSRTKQLA